MQEHFFQGPYCWESISMLIDISQSQQRYIESRSFGSEVCCNPIQIQITTQNQEITSFDAQNIEQ